MLLKLVFDKTSFVKFKISNNFKKNIDEIMKHIPNNKKSIGKSISAYGFKKSQKNLPTKSLDTFAKRLKFPTKKTIPWPRVADRIRIRIQIADPDPGGQK